MLKSSEMEYIFKCLTALQCMLKKNFDFFSPLFWLSAKTTTDITLQNECTQFILNTEREKNHQSDWIEWRTAKKKLCNQCWPQFAIKIFKHVNHNILTHRNVCSKHYYYGSDMWIRVKPMKQKLCPWSQTLTWQKVSWHQNIFRFQSVAGSSGQIYCI